MSWLAFAGYRVNLSQPWWRLRCLWQAAVAVKGPRSVCPRRRGVRPLNLEILEDRTLLTSWTHIGHGAFLNGETPGHQPVSGRITALAADPTDANTFYIGAAGGGVWKTTDGGSTWTPLTDNQSTLFTGALAVAHGTPSVLYAGTGEANNSGDSYYGRGILKSTDGGATWTLLGNTLFDRRTIARIVVDPNDANHVYVAVADFGANGKGGHTGIWKSSNGGTNWTNTTAGLPHLAHIDAFTDLVMDPTSSQILYGAVGTPGGGKANGVYKTSDGGHSWSVAGDFPMGIGDSTIRIALAPSVPQTLYAAVTDPSTGGLARMMKTTDGGAHWVQLVHTPDYLTASSDQGQGDYDSTLAVDPTQADIVYAGGSFDQGSLIQSTDGGLTWTDIHKGADGNGVHPDQHAFAFDAAGRLLAGNDGGIWRLDNAQPSSIHWTDLNGSLDTLQFNGIALHPTDPNLLYGASQDNGTDRYGVAGWSVVQEGDGGVVHVEASNLATVFRTAEWGANGFFARSDDSGVTWTAKVAGINLQDDARFYFPVVLDAAHPGRLLLGSDHVYETIDGGDHWTALAGPGTPGWTTSAVIDSLAVVPTDSNTIYAAAGGHVFVTTNHGLQWARIDPVAAPSPWLNLADLFVDPADPQSVYAVAANFASDSRGGHVWRTANGGKTWTNITSNLPDLPTWTIAVASQGLGHAGNVLFVGTDAGVYTSTNLGVSWARFGAGLPNAQVMDLELNPTLGILAAGTHGRGLWEIAVDSPAAATHFTVSASSAAAGAGTAVAFTVTALDVSGNLAAGYAGTVHFSSSDPHAALPGDYTFTAADGGQHTFTGIVLKTAGGQTVMAADLTIPSVAGLSVTVLVSPAAVDHLAVSVPASNTAGTASNVTVTAQDPFNNTVPSYPGTVAITSNDSQATLPAAYVFLASDNGTHTYSGVTLLRAGNSTITATDTTNSGLTGSAQVLVRAATASTLTLAGFPASIAAGTAGSFTVTAQDSYGNLATGYLGTITFGSSDPQAALPAGYTFGANDGGVHTFTATLVTAGARSLSVQDTDNNSLRGTQAGITVSPAAASTLMVTGLPATVVAGSTTTITVTARDAYGNTATGYTGTVTFSSSDALATLPATYTFTASDGGVRTAGITFGTPGPQTLTVADSGASLSSGLLLTVVPPPLSLTESFDGTAVGALPAGWSQWSSTGKLAFGVTSLQSVSAPNGLAVVGPSSKVAARAWLNTLVPADVQVSASVYLNGLIPAQVLARGSGLNTATPSYYAVGVTRGLQVQLLRVVNGVTTPLGQIKSASYVSGQWVRVTLNVSGATLQAQVYRLDRKLYLTSAGQWQAAPAWALGIVDTALTAFGQVGLARPASYAGALVYDDFTVAPPVSNQPRPSPGQGAAPPPAQLDRVGVPAASLDFPATPHHAGRGTRRRTFRAKRPHRSPLRQHGNR